MKIFISYKQTGVDKKILDEKLSLLKDKLSIFCQSSYCLWLDDKPNFYEKNILLDKIKHKIKDSDLIVFLVDSNNKSEGQLMELGMAYALWKKIILLVNREVKDNYYLAYWTTNKIFEFDNLQNLDFKKILW